MQSYIIVSIRYPIIEHRKRTLLKQLLDADSLGVVDASGGGRVVVRGERVRAKNERSILGPKFQFETSDLIFTSVYIRGSLSPPTPLN